MNLSDDEARRLAELVIDEYTSMHPEDAELIEEKKSLARKVTELLDRQRCPDGWICIPEKRALVVGLLPCTNCGEWFNRLGLQVHDCPKKDKP